MFNYFAALDSRLFAPVFATKFVACSRLSKVPASVHQPSSCAQVIVPSLMIIIVYVGNFEFAAIPKVLMF